MATTFEKKQMATNKILVVIATLGLILTIIGLIFTYFQIQINKSNTRLYEQSVRPDLIISSDNLDGKTQVIYQKRISSINLDNSAGQTFNFFITNIGKIDARGILIKINNPWASNNYQEFESIASGEVKFGHIILATKECQDWSAFGRSQGMNLDSCKESGKNISLGEQDLQLKIECINCDPPVQYTSIKVCFESINNNVC